MTVCGLVPPALVAEEVSEHTGSSQCIVGGPTAGGIPLAHPDLPHLTRGAAAVADDLLREDRARLVDGRHRGLLELVEGEAASSQVLARLLEPAGHREERREVAGEDPLENSVVPAPLEQ